MNGLSVTNYFTLVATLGISLSRPSDSMNRNGKRMTPEATHLIEAQQCESASDFIGFEASSLSLTSTTDCFAPLFKRKLDICMTKSGNRLRHFNETLTN